MWISVEEKTPEKGQQVLVYGNFCTERYTPDNIKSIGLVLWDSANCSSCSDACYYAMEYEKITHWQPIKSPTNLKTMQDNLIERLKDIDLTKAYKKEINDGFINCIWLEDSNWDYTLGVSDDNTEVTLQTAGKALIQFANGKHILVDNSEWCSLYIY